ncbi:MAG: hypothetical protein ABI837_17355, partial [Acidobacteriota bacterium]
MNGVADQKRFARIRPIKPLPALLGSVRVFILDASLDGFRIAHQERFAESAAAVQTISIDWEGERAWLECTVEWTEAQHPAKPNAKTLYHSGLQIHSMQAHARELLREVIEHHVKRALDEQRANARGIPAVAAQSFQTGGGNRFMKHEQFAGKWRVVTTTETRQPRNGFTVSAALEDHEVAMLRDAYNAADA